MLEHQVQCSDVRLCAGQPMGAPVRSLSAVRADLHTQFHVAGDTPSC